MCENYFTEKEVESILKKNTKSLKYLFKSKRLKYFRIHGKIRVSEENLNDFFKLTGLPPLKNQMAAN
ncbi:MAG: hypothetical protein NTW78_03955 [Campylobacterales bacterium]|nr:hypothetical protein [Campylobacterales bacterium]